MNKLFKGLLVLGVTVAVITIVKNGKKKNTDNETQDEA